MNAYVYLIGVNRTRIAFCGFMTRDPSSLIPIVTPSSTSSNSQVRTNALVHARRISVATAFPMHERAPNPNATSAYMHLRQPQTTSHTNTLTLCAMFASALSYRSGRNSFGRS
jgi:hypothetical protein